MDKKSKIQPEDVFYDKPELTGKSKSAKTMWRSDEVLTKLSHKVSLSRNYLNVSKVITKKPKDLENSLQPPHNKYIRPLNIQLKKKNHKIKKLSP